MAEAKANVEKQLYAYFITHKRTFFPLGRSYRKSGVLRSGGRGYFLKSDTVNMQKKLFAIWCMCVCTYPAVTKCKAAFRHRLHNEGDAGDLSPTPILKARGIIPPIFGDFFSVFFSTFLKKTLACLFAK